jgi:tripartite-type tricarboxylate transporter receptor subunit TctC
MNIIKFFSLIACLSYAHIGFAQTATTWPNRTVKIVSGLGPGSSMDLVARSIAPALSEIWGQSVIVENKTGAAGLRSALLFIQNSLTI